MTGFRYVAVRPDGRRVRGSLEAGTPAEAAHTLGDRGLFPLSVKPASARARRRWWPQPIRPLATMMESLASLAEIGVPLHRALDATAELVEGDLRSALLRVRDLVREGATLSGALAQEPHLCPPVALGLVRAGERGVGLAAGLRQAARHLEHQAETRAGIQAALAYPALLLTAGSVSIMVILLFVLPRFAALLADLHDALPPLTRALLAVSAGVRDHGLALALAGGGGLLLALLLARRWRDEWAGWLLRLPVVGGIRHGLATARVSRALGALLDTGVSTLPALAVACEAAGDVALRRRLEKARRRVGEGAALGDALGETHALTAGALQLVRIGERSGRLPELLEQAATLEERAASRRLRALVTGLEPLLIVAFAAAVALIAGALLQALYSVRPGAL